MAYNLSNQSLWATYKGYIVQGLTEAFPISSSFHLKLLGANIDSSAHFATAVAGIIWLFANGLLIAFIQRCFVIIKNFLYEVFCFLFTNKKNFDMTPNLYVFIIFLMTAGFLLLKFRLAPAMFRNINGAIIGFIFASFMLIAEMNENQGENVDFKQFGKIHLAASIFMNCMGLIPGASRLGATYTCLRMLRLSRKQAFAIAVSEGAVGIFVGQIIMSSLQHKSAFGIFKLVSNRYDLLPIALCGVIYYIILNLLMDKTHHILLAAILLSSIYRMFVIPFM